jgi:uncharacterized protein (DUF2147 family)
LSAQDPVTASACWSKRKDEQMKTSLIVLFLLAVAASCFAATGDDVVGTWLNQDKDAKIQIMKCGDKYCGKIVWLKEPTYPPGSKDGTPGTEKIDHKNPDPALRKTPTLGLMIVKDMTYAGDDLWKDGKVYDPKSGKTYNAKMTLISPTQLNLRGFIGFSLIGRTDKWTKAE